MRRPRATRSATPSGSTSRKPRRTSHCRPPGPRARRSSRLTPLNGRIPARTASPCLLEDTNGPVTPAVWEPPPAVFRGAQCRRGDIHCGSIAGTQRALVRLVEGSELNTGNGSAQYLPDGTRSTLSAVAFVADWMGNCATARTARGRRLSENHMPPNRRLADPTHCA